MGKVCNICGGYIAAPGEVFGYSGPMCNGIHGQQQGSDLVAPDSKQAKTHTKSALPTPSAHSESIEAKVTATLQSAWPRTKITQTLIKPLVELVESQVNEAKIEELSHLESSEVWYRDDNVTMISVEDRIKELQSLQEGK